jgi:uncharacterized membrane protein YsdA (DUF1294 family)
MDKEQILLIYSIYLIALTVITFILYGFDKLKAKIGGKRIAEKTLLCLSVLGGALGAILAMKIFRHKTAKEHRYFSVVNFFGLIIHFALFALILFSK